MQVPTQDQVNAALRHVGTATATAATVFVVLGLLNADQSAAVIADMKDITDGLGQAVGGFSKLLIVVGPVAALWFGKGAVAAASLHRQLTSIVGNPTVKVDGKIIVPPAVADAVPSDKVVAK
jgi:hypothetical protein